MKYGKQIFNIANSDRFVNVCNIQQINRAEAEKLWNAGEVVYMHPCNLRVIGTWQTPFRIKKSDEFLCAETFEKVLNAYSAHNCNKETGYRVIFFKNV